MHAISELPNSPVIVTGAASGIGHACAIALAEVGRPVALWDIDKQRAVDAASILAKETDTICVGLGVDVADPSAIEAAAKETREVLGSIGGLVHAAGVSGAVSLEHIDIKTWNQILDINLRAQLFIIQAILDDLKNIPNAAVVGISSINATLGNAANPAYSASKGGLNAMTRALADDLARHNIRINTVAPGQIDTPMLQYSMAEVEGLKESFERRIMLGRLGTPQEVAKVVRFLLSSDASYITAAEIIVDGGNIASQRS